MPCLIGGDGSMDGSRVEVLRGAGLIACRTRSVERLFGPYSATICVFD